MLKYDKYKNKGLTGLSNVGNTCYINSCMQILSNTYELNELLDNIKRDKINDNNDGILMKEWDDLRKMMWQNNCTIAPVRFVKIIQKISLEKDRLDFSGFEQNDVSEFLLFVIDCFHNGLKREVDMNISGDIKNELDELALDCYKMMQNMYKKEYSEILNIFYGISINQIKEVDGDKILSKTCEPFSVLTLSIPENKKTCTIFDCLDEYTKDELMSGDNAWFNDKTNKKEDVKRGIIFWNLPNILIIDLKRFNNVNRKVHTLVTTEINNIDFSNYVHGYNANDNNFDLFGTTNHSGNTHGGHYTANIRNANDKWYNFNDTNVREVEKNNLITPYTYCLFYRKKNKI